MKYLDFPIASLHDFVRFDLIDEVLSIPRFSNLEMLGITVNPIENLFLSDHRSELDLVRKKLKLCRDRGIVRFTHELDNG